MHVVIVIVHFNCPCRNGTPQFRASPHILAYNPAENAILLCSNTTTPENAYYELFAVPKNSDPSNPDCKLQMYILVAIVYHAVHV